MWASPARRGRGLAVGARPFSRMTIPTVPVADVAAGQHLLFIDEADSVRAAMTMLISTGHDVVAVNSSRPGGDKDETIGVLTEYSLLAKVRSSPRPSLSARRPGRPQSTVG